MIRPSKTKTLERLRKALGAIPELRDLPARSQEFKKWKRNTEVAIEHTFGATSRHLEEFKEIHYTPIAFVTGIRSDWQTPYLNGLSRAEPMLESMIEEIEEYWEDDGNTTTASKDTATREPPDVAKAFVVHGRDEGAKETISSLLQRLGIEPIILAEKASKGRTIIEKFEHHADVRFAIVLLTPDDTGALRSKDDKISMRARQNVIFELGFFIGKLGRDRVCALTKGDLEIPSDYSGVVYIAFEDGGWKLALLRELRAAGFPVDANALIGG